jgi:monoamine oxidase
MRCLNKALAAHQVNIPPDQLQDQYNEKRRAFLINNTKAIAAIGLSGLLGSCRKMIDVPETLQLSAPKGVLSETARIAIVGGGIAGLHASFILKSKGLASTIYEGSTRLGGRMYTGRNVLGQGTTTELGGEFIDSIHKDMLTLAKTFNLELLDTRAAQKDPLHYQAYYFNGTHYTEAQVIEAFLPYADRIKADQLKMSGLITADSFSAFDQLLDNLSLAQYFDRIGLTGWLRNLLDVAYVTEYGQPIDQQTALNFLWLISPKVTNGRFEIFGASDERYKIKGGNDQITSLLAKDLDGQIQVNHRLIEIRQLSNNTYDLIFQVDRTTKTVNADFVLLTLPFTLLREVTVRPGWPVWKQKAIFDIGYGNNSKVMLGFKKRYWYDQGYAGYYFTDLFLQSGWENTALQSSVNSGGLTVYSGGPEALNAGKGSLSTQVQKHLAELEKMYPGAVAQYNGKSERFIWPEYRWTKGSYTCFKPGQYTTIAGNEIKPVGNIFFAGEHCSYDYQGYMNGGAETGRRAAEAILQRI